ncbi:carbamoyltransferase HypF [Bacillus taeanensis]|uniref:Carbamoyltransferase n=1 Tax=Bacillus taeanensis TaxID=273032 RepID=A0A366Y3K6_9BACI|nr:carbamoyltransferase HypF [Bacillus taeanensis]RBW70964.1 carbamoyltransferase HypF [Bacillus taeanensis]
MDKALNISLTGRVQGVGFRPFVSQVAKKCNITGTVQNNMDGVKIHAEGTEESLNYFLQILSNSSPRLARVDQVSVKEVSLKEIAAFSIIPSEKGGSSSLVIPVDSAVCRDCLKEMNDPKNVRYRYPFINCTQCGPRYTIIHELPYDRSATSMKSFTMCKVCQAEYEDPNNRRHHAQPIACPKCGPHVFLQSITGEKIAEQHDAIEKVKELFNNGTIIAVKGLGGYHLACDASNHEAISRLRRRKNRPYRPFAVMASSIEVIQSVCHLSPLEEKALQSPEAPIVVLRKRREYFLPSSLSPGLKSLGVMLPYTPLHTLLFEEEGIPFLIMTSANRTGMPILYKDEEAFSSLQGIADYILTHNRSILHPLDDSVVQINNGAITFLRRSRGYVPDPLQTTHLVHHTAALGGQQKNTFAIGRHQQIFLGPHIGDLTNIEVIEHSKREYSHLEKWIGASNEVTVIDMHPQYTTAMLVKKMKGEVVTVQHHHAHMVSCMEDNHLSDPCFGLILDGTGYGEDGNIWGFEVLYGDASSFRRLGHLRYTPLPGGEAAVKEPWRTAVGMLIHYFGIEGENLAKQLFPNRVYEIGIIAMMVKKEMNSPLAGTCGRLFDAVSAILGICMEATYDGEPAIRLSEYMTDAVSNDEHYPFYLLKNREIIIDASEMIRCIIDDYLNARPLPQIVQTFHQTIVKVCVDTLLLIVDRFPSFNRKVMLSGGCFHNAFLVSEITKALQKFTFDVYTHQRVPCSDGGIALGQLIIAANRKGE